GAGRGWAHRHRWQPAGRRHAAAFPTGPSPEPPRRCRRARASRRLRASDDVEFLPSSGSPRVAGQVISVRSLTPLDPQLINPGLAASPEGASLRRSNLQLEQVDAADETID